MIRDPAVAGSFYPSAREALLEALESLTPTSDSMTDALGVLVPHAGYIYSGRVAGSVYSRVVLPDRCIILCPNHTGLGPPLSIMSSGAWRTPLGSVTIDSDLARRLKGLNPLLDEDSDAHRMEHAIEVQLPFLQSLRGPNLRFVPITVGTSDLTTLLALGSALAELIESEDERVLIVASSDMNHYESDSRTREKDRWAIDYLLKRDPEGLHQTVLKRDISMCGFGPATSMLAATNLLGALQAELVSYETSGDAFGERERVVGYAGVIVS